MSGDVLNNEPQPLADQILASLFGGGTLCKRGIARIERCIVQAAVSSVELAIRVMAFERRTSLKMIATMMIVPGEKLLDQFHRGCHRLESTPPV